MLAMSEQSKKKPPRPPAPKFKNKKSTKDNSTSITLHFKPSLAGDEDDGLGSDDPLQISISKGPASVSAKKPQEGNISQRPTSVSSRASSKSFDSSGSQEGINVKQKVSPTKSSPVLASPPLSRLQSTSSVTSVSTQEDPLHMFQEEGDPYDDAFKADSKQTKEKKNNKNLPKVKETGLVKVKSEALSSPDNDLHLEGMSENGDIDPLTLISQLIEKEGYAEKENQQNREKEEHHKDEVDARNDHYISRGTGHGKDGGDLEVNPYYFNVPTPDELPDEPVAHPKERDGPISFTGLLEKSAKDDSSSQSVVVSEEESSSSSSDKVDHMEKLASPKEPQELTTFSVTAKEKPVLESPKPTLTKKLSAPVTVVHSPPPVLLLGFISLALFVYMIYPLPSYLTGLITGIVVSFYGSLGLIWVNLPPKSKKFDESSIDDKAPLAAPGERMSAAKVKLKVQEEKFHSIWMNELEKEYDPETYHISQTQSVFVRLEGHTLRLSTPRRNIPRRAMWDEPTPKPEFVHQRIIDIKGGTVFLQPHGLVNKRLWSKKYPICIELPEKGMSIKRQEIKTSFDDETGVDAGDFEVIKKEECEDKLLTLFARTGREKEEWFWRFELAVKHKKVDGRKPIPTLNKKINLKNRDYRDEEGNLHHVRSDTFDPLAKKGLVDFYKFIAKVLPREKELKEVTIPPVNVKASGVTYASPTPKEKKAPGEIGVTLDSPLAWANALVGRVFWDFLREEHWADVVQYKLQKKLDKLKIPRFIEELRITDTDLGVNSPIIKRASPPTIDSQGIWVYLDISYSGSCCITLNTKFNPWKLGTSLITEQEMEEIEPMERREITKQRTNSSAALDSDEEDSAESSDEEVEGDQSFSSDTSSGNKTDESSGPRVSGKFMRFVNKVANSNYFQRATQNKYVKRAFDEVSNTPVVLTVEVKELRGTLAVNIPPPPTDRLWYGFREKPHLWLSAKPKLGARQVTITHVTDYIEKKLALEFQKVFVLPNMDDVVIPIMRFDVEENRL